ncbi:MAG TPA: hypothetical protein V6D33_05340 [Cyanophyceae cyanobacterium]
MGLSNGLNDPTKKASLVADCVKLIDEQVATKGGLSGLALKAAYATVKGINPDYIARAVEGLLPEVLSVIEPIWSEGTQKGDPVEYLTQNQSRTADAILSITDAKIEKSNNGIVRGAYNRLRNSAKKDVEEAIPGLAKIIDNYTKA